MTNRTAIISQLKLKFNVKELVCPDVYNKWGENAWRFLDTNLLETILVLRTQIINKPMIVNNSSTFTHRGLRCNLCELVKSKKTPYLSAHVLGKAIDFSVPGETAENIRTLIKSRSYLLPCPVRLEKDVTWVHVDVMEQDGFSGKVYEFKG